MYLNKLNFISLLLKKISPVSLAVNPEASAQAPFPLTWFLNLNSLQTLNRFMPKEYLNYVSNMNVYSLSENNYLLGSYRLASEQLNLKYLGATIDSQSFFDHLLSTPDNQKHYYRPLEKSDILIDTQLEAEQKEITESLGVASTGFLEIKKSDFKPNTAWQIFTPSWILGLLPHNDKFYHFVFSSSEDLPFPSLQLETIFKKLNINLGSTPYKLSPAVQIRTFHRRNYRHSKKVLLADALHQIHPLAGQGLNLGIADLKVFLQTLENNPKSNIGLIQENLIKHRYAKNELMYQFCKHTFYAKSSFGLNLGLNLFDRFDLIKQILFEHYQQCEFSQCPDDAKI